MYSYRVDLVPNTFRAIDCLRVLVDCNTTRLGFEAHYDKVTIAESCRVTTAHSLHFDDSLNVEIKLHVMKNDIIFWYLRF